MTEQQRVMMIAALAGADPRTVRKQLEGKPAHGAVLRERIDAAARQVEGMPAGASMPAPAAERAPEAAPVAA